MNTFFRKSLLALGSAAVITVGAMSVASATSSNFAEQDWQAQVRQGQTVAPGGANLALPFAGRVTNSGGVNCFDIVGAPGRYAQDQVSSCQHQTGSH